MKYLLSITLAAVFLFSCRNNETIIPRNISKVEINTLMEDSLLNVRALEVVKPIDAYNLWDVFYAGANSIVGKFQDNMVFEDKIIDGGQYVFKINDSIIYNNLHFRSIAATNKCLLVLTIGSPAQLFKFEKFGTYPSLVYKENHPKAFYDSIDFWNDEEGIAIGDSIDGCLSIIITRDGGETWTKLSCENLPKAEKGEGAFAASDTNIAIVGNNTWVATTHGNVYYSPDKGKSWEVIKTPIIQEEPTEGIYSIDFYDELNGFAIGGDYTKPKNNLDNKIKTADGGKTWQLVASGKTPNFRSCVQYIPNRNGKELVAIGFNGIDFSNDSGDTWKHLSDEGFYTIQFLNDSVAYAAGAGRISKLTFRE